MAAYLYPNTYVTRVIDGDTVVLDIDFGFKLWQRQITSRLAGINAPEMSTAAGLLARQALLNLLGPLPAQLTLRSVRDTSDKYGRYLAVLIRADGTNLNEAMVTLGHAVPYPPKLPPGAVLPSEPDPDVQ